MKQMLFCMGMLLITSGFFAGCCETDAAVSVSALKCEQDPAPLNLETPTPRFSWQIFSERRGTEQTACRILVADSYEALAGNEGTLWDSRKVRSGNQLLIPYAGDSLEAGTRYWWKVRVWDNHGNASEWSEPASFAMGLPTPEDWDGAQWIALETDNTAQILVPSDVQSPERADNLLGKNTPFGMYALPQFRRAFTVEGTVKRAMVYVCGLGQFELFVNGGKAGDHFMDPAWTKYDKNAQYVAFDITEQLGGGENVLGVMLGNGFYNVPRERYFKMLTSYGAPKMILKARIEYADGSEEVIVSDESWRTSPSAVTYSSIFGGEDFDAAAEQRGWKEAGFDDAAWTAPVTGNHFSPRLTAQRSTPLRVAERIPAETRYKNGAGNWTYDLGQNASGIVRIGVRSGRSQTVKLLPAELIDDDGTANQHSSGQPFYYRYTTRGAGETEWWQPQFTYYGQRYVEVVGAVPAGEPNPQGLPEIVEVSGLHTRNSAETVGDFHCSNELFNKIHDLIDWSVRSNLSHVLTDCPHREKLGWLEVAHLMGASIQSRYDISRVYAKKVGDMAVAQQENGMIPTIAPFYVTFNEGFLDTPEWGSAYVIVPWYMYRWYGDRSLLEQNYDNMARYVSYLGTKAENHIVAYGLGDWCDIGPERPGYAQLTGNGVTATAIYYYNVGIMRQTAELFGKTADAARYAALGEEIRKAFNRTFWNPETKTYDRNSQTANAVVLCMDLCEPENRTTVLENLIGDIRARGNALTAGDIGYRYVLRALEENGASEVIFDMNSRYDVPGYGYQLAHGATSLAESWQTYRQMSNNHCMLGHLMEWFYSGLLGITQTPESVAYKEVVIRPQVVGDIHEARGSFRSPYGIVRSEWRDAPERFTLLAEIPAGSTGLIHLPAASPEAITESGVPVTAVADATVAGTNETHTVIRVGSGTYRFEIAKR